MITPVRFSAFLRYERNVTRYFIFLTFVTALFLVGTPASGQTLDWVNQPLIAGIGGTDEGRAIACDASGNVYVTGYFEGTADFDPGAGTANLSSAGLDIFIAKYDASGNYMWAKRIGGSGDERGFSLAVDGNDNVYVTGHFGGTVDFDPGAGIANLTSAGGSDIFIAKYDASGSYLWAIRAGGTNDDRGNDLAVDGSGGVHVTGYFQGSNVDFDPGAGTANLTSAGGFDIFISKYDASGNYLWANRMGGSSIFGSGDMGYGIVVDDSGNVHVTGNFQGSNVDFDPGAGTANLSSAGNLDVFIAKYDASGNYVWAKRLGGSSNDESNDIALDGSGSVHVTGRFQGTADFDPGAGTVNLSSAGASDIFIAKYDASGNYVWANRLGGTNHEIGYVIAVDGSGNLYITGYFWSSNVDFDPGAGTANLSNAGGFDMFIAKYDASGNYEWAGRIGGLSDDTGFGLALDGSGSVHVVGYFSGSDVDFDPGAGTASLNAGNGNRDAFVLRLSSAGAYGWAINWGTYVSYVSMDCRAIARDASGNVYVTGHFAGKVDFDPGAGIANLSSAGGSNDVFIAKYEASGNYVWAKQMGGTSGDIGFGIALDVSGNVYVTGQFQGTADFDPGAGTANLSSAGGYDIFIAKYDASGNYVWANRVGGTSHEVSNGIAVDGSGNVHVTGSFLGNDVDFDPGAGTANLSSVGGDDIFIAKYDALGNYVWANRIGGTGDYDTGLGLSLDGSGNVHVTGRFQGTADFDPGAGTANLSSNGSSIDIDVFIAKYDASGNYVWAIRVGGGDLNSELDDWGYSIALDGSGNVHVTGQFQGTDVDFDPGPGTANLSSSCFDIFIAKYDASGNYLWAIGINDSGCGEGIGLALDGNGNVYVTGHFQGTDIDFDPGPGTANLSTTEEYVSDIFVAQYDASGNYGWAISAGGSEADDIGYCIAAGGSGKVNVGGKFYGTVDFDPGAGTANLTSASGFDMFIAQYTFPVKEIALEGNSQNITNGDTDPSASDHTDFGTVATGCSLSRTFTIENTGNGNLTLTGTAPDYVTLSGSAGFTISQQPASSIIGAGNSATFEITYTPPASGTATATVNIASDDADENPFTFDIKGTGANLSVGIGVAETSGTNNDGTICNGASADLSANVSGSTGPFSYAWTPNIGSGAGPHTVNPAANTPYSVEITDANGCTVSAMTTVTVIACTFISGDIEWHIGTPGGTGVNNATVNLTGAATGSSVTDIKGDYAITALTGGNFTITPVKNANKLNGITVADVTAIQQHIAGITLITNPYRQVAADVNKSNSITSLDATVLNQALIGNPATSNHFKTSWRFVPKSHTMSLPPWGFPEKIELLSVSGNQADQDFYGIKTGDLVATFADPAGLISPPLVLRAQDRALEAGEELTVEFSADQFDDLAAWQFALQFDPTQMQLVEIQPLAALPLTAENFGTFNLAEGEIRAVWSQATGAFLEEAAPVFSLKFKVLQGGGKLSEALYLNDAVLPAYAYNSALAESEIDLEFFEITGTGPNAGAAEYRLLQNTPNPFTDKTTVGFVLPGACEAVLRVFDASGRLLREHTAWFPAGKNAVDFDLGAQTASGVFYYELTTQFGVLAKKMVAAER